MAAASLPISLMAVCRMLGALAVEVSASRAAGRQTQRAIREPEQRTMRRGNGFQNCALAIAQKSLRIALGTTIAATCALTCHAQQASPDLADRSLTDLMNMQVTSVSKTAEPLSRTAAAIFVITQEDIRRSGATNIPDLLRMVPGMDVAQINSNTWAISARGLNGQFSNELLVLLDGRNVYTPTFGGVFWDVLDLPLEDIERIEVIRGPGGSVWGSNAVNGVVNIITKKSGDTPGAMLEA